MKCVIEFDDRRFEFDTPAEATAFAEMVYNGFYDSNKDDVSVVLCRFIDCYLHDTNNTPIEQFIDYLCENWKTEKDLHNKWQTLANFYNYIEPDYCN